MMPQYFLAASRNRHWAVIGSTVGVLLLKLTTVASTGLIVLEPTKITTTNNPFLLTSTFSTDVSALNNVTGSPGNQFFGVQAQGLSYPKGVGSDLVVQNFHPQGILPPGATYSAEVQGLQTNFDCEIVEIDNSTVGQVGLPWFSVLAPYFIAHIDAGNCSIRNAIIAQGADHTYHHDPYATQNFQGRITNVTCSDGIDISAAPTDRPDHSNYSDQRVLMTMADLRWYIPTDYAGGPEQTGDIYWVQEVKAVLCRPSYSLNTYRVNFSATLNTSQGPVSAELIRNGTSTLPGLSNAQLAQSVLTVLDSMYIGSGGADYILATNVQNFFQLLSASNNGSRQEAFMDPQLLLDLGSTVWKGVSSQTVYEYLNIPIESIVYGSIYHTENRLQVKLLSTVLMAVTLSMLCGSAIAIMISRPKNTTSCDPTSALAKAAIFAASPTVLNTLADTGLARLDHIEKGLRCYTVQSRFSHDNSVGTLCVEVLGSRSSEESTISSEERKKDDSTLWWMPMATKHWFLCVAVLLPIMIIITLEVLQHISETKQGLVPVNPGSILSSQVMSHYLPAAIMLVVGTLFTTIRDTAAILAPYSKLKRGDAPISTIAHSLVGKMALQALLFSTKDLDLGHFMSLLAVLVVPFLTIVVSGLYVATPVYASLNATLILNDRFDFTQASLSLSDNNAASITNLIEWSNLSYPDWTYRGLAFNKLGTRGSLPGTGLVLVDIPAYRAKLDCEVPMDDTYTVTLYNGEVGTINQLPNMTAIAVQRSLPMPCLSSAANPNVTWSQHLFLPDDHSPSYMGQASLIQWQKFMLHPVSNTSESITILAGDGGIYPVYYGMVESPASDLNVGGYSCPSFGVTIGSGSLTETTLPNGTNVTAASADLTFLMCFQRLEQVQTRVAFNLPELSINTTVSPRIDESTAVAVNNSALRDGVWEWPINTLLTSLTVGDTQSSLKQAPLPGGNPAYENNLDPFLKTIVAGQSGVPIRDLLGDSARTRDRLINASQILYSDYMAQAISANMRNTTLLPSTSYPAQTIDIPVWRLQQNRGSKIALQAMLGFLALSAVSMYLSLDTRRVLLHNPCSLAGVATILVGSEHLERNVMPLGAEWVPVEQLQRLPIFQGLRLYLGWKHDSEGAQHEDATFGMFLE